MYIQFARSRLFLALFGLTLLSTAQAGSFVYEGQLDDRGAPANGRYDIQLAVYRDAELGATVTAPIVFSAVDVKDGRFRLDFDARLQSAEPAWVEVAVRDAGGSSFSAIPGRTKAVQAPAAIGACWSSVGDSGSNPATNFLGTTDAQPLVLRTGNVRSLRIEPSTELFAGTPITANVIAGSSANAVTAGVRGATISGGGVPTGESDPNYFDEAPNRVTDAYGSVGGGYANRAGDNAGTTVDGSFATVAGGFYNTAATSYSSIGGGYRNTTGGGASTVAGGYFNTASGTNSSIGGGSTNGATGAYSFVGGGDSNAATGPWSAAAGGIGNTASGLQSTVAGGDGNCAGGATSWSGGSHAKVRPGTGSGAAVSGCSGVALSGDADGDEGSFVWADSQVANFVSTGADQFLVRAAGGMAVNTNDPGSSTFRVNGTIRVDTLGTFSAGASPLCRNIGNQISLCSSSQRYKDDIADLPPSLDKVLALRPVSYNWKVTGTPDVGFVAEEVAKLDERLITRNDAGQIEGVKYERLSALLASAVQELSAREQLQAREIADLRKDLAELRTLIEAQRTGDR